MALIHVDFFSDVLGMCSEMDVILPEPDTKTLIGMQNGAVSDTYPTLYLLHGMSDDHTIWQRRTSIERYASEAGIAVVMPSTHLGWYTDMYRGFAYHTYIAKELPEICRAFFPHMSSKREKTFVAGLSMGGYGALKLGLCDSETFGYAASLSGGVGMPTFLKDMPQGEQSQLWEDIFGPKEMHENSENDLFYRAEQLVSSDKPKPKLYMWCGTEDFLYSQNTAMRDHLQKLGYDLTYEESPGNHQWKYWDEKIQDVLSWLQKQSSATQKS